MKRAVTCQTCQIASRNPYRFVNIRFDGHDKQSHLAHLSSLSCGHIFCGLCLRTEFRSILRIRLDAALGPVNGILRDAPSNRHDLQEILYDLAPTNEHERKKLKLYFMYDCPTCGRSQNKTPVLARAYSGLIEGVEALAHSSVDFNLSDEVLDDNGFEGLFLDVFPPQLLAYILFKNAS